MEKMFEKATRAKLRFETSKGNLSVEDLWDLPLSARDGFDLDSVAKAASKKLKETQEESFVKPATVSNTEHELKLEIVKFIISVKLKEKADREEAATKSETKKKLMEVLARKQDAALESMSAEEIEAKINSL
jgi:uncharacterized protein YabN with tetrapyrrole methylase and pyrophosphatase domain